VGDNAAARVGCEQRCVQQVKLYECGHPQLSAFENYIQIVHVAKKIILFPTHAERHDVAALIHDAVQTVHPQKLALQKIVLCDAAVIRARHRAQKISPPAVA
jgi:hypothetical protein